MTGQAAEKQEMQDEILNFYLVINATGKGCWFLLWGYGWLKVGNWGENYQYTVKLADEIGVKLFDCTFLTFKA